MSFAATWVYLEIIILSEARQRKANMFIIFKVIFNQKAYCKTLVYK